MVGMAFTGYILKAPPPAAAVAAPAIDYAKLAAAVKPEPAPTPAVKPAAVTPAPTPAAKRKPAARPAARPAAVVHYVIARPHACGCAL